MATDERDPKINPQAGDVLVDGDYTYEVTSRAGSWIVYKATEERTMPLGQWHMLRPALPSSPAARRTRAMAEPIKFFAPGQVAPGGSKTAMRRHGAAGIYVKDACRRNGEWRGVVAAEATRAMVGRRPIEGPVRLSVVFRLLRPKCHYGTGRNAGAVKPSAPTYHAQAPDATKLLRSTEDALKGIAWRDDSQVAIQHAEKRWVHGQPGAEITIEEL